MTQINNNYGVSHIFSPFSQFSFDSKSSHCTIICLEMAYQINNVRIENIDLKYMNHIMENICKIPLKVFIGVYQLLPNNDCPLNCKYVNKYRKTFNLKNCDKTSFNYDTKDLIRFFSTLMSKAENNNLPISVIFTKGVSTILIHIDKYLKIHIFDSHTRTNLNIPGAFIITFLCIKNAINFIEKSLGKRNNDIDNIAYNQVDCTFIVHKNSKKINIINNSQEKKKNNNQEKKKNNNQKKFVKLNLTINFNNIIPDNQKNNCYYYLKCDYSIIYFIINDGIVYQSLKKIYNFGFPINFIDLSSINSNPICFEKIFKRYFKEILGKINKKQKLDLYKKLIKFILKQIVYEDLYNKSITIKSFNYKNYI